MFRNRKKNPEGALWANKELVQYIDNLFVERKKRPRDDFFNLLTTIEVDGRKLDDKELRRYAKIIAYIQPMADSNLQALVCRQRKAKI